MTERARQEPVLLPDTRDLLEEIRRCTGVPVEVRADPSVRGHGRAVYAATDIDTSRHLILYDPKFESFLDHLGGHECGHLVRFACASSVDRVVPVLTSDKRYELTLQLLPEIERLIRAGLPEGAVAEVLPIWLGGTVAQLQNTPADIHIERWLHREFPGLRAVQERSIASMAREYHQVLQPQVERCTPRLLWEASNAMNYAYLKSMADLMERPDFVRPYLRTQAASIGRELLEVLDGSADIGLAGDRLMSDRWAERLRLRGWLNWTLVDRLPVEARRIWRTGGGAITWTENVMLGRPNGKSAGPSAVQSWSGSGRQ